MEIFSCREDPLRGGGAVAEERAAARAGRCGKAKGARIQMIPASVTDEEERRALSREVGHAMERTRRAGREVDRGLVRAKEAIDDEENHLLVIRSRWGEFLGSLSYTFPGAGTLRVDYIGLSIHRCGLGTRLMAAVAALALGGDRAIRLTAEKDAKGFFAGLGMDRLEEYPDGNCVFGFSPEGMRNFLARSRTTGAVKAGKGAKKEGNFSWRVR